MNPLKLLWSFSGRIGRLAYLGGTFLNIAWAVAAIAVLSYFDQGPKPPELPSPIVVSVFFAGFILLIWAKFALAAKRFHDVGDSGWLSLLLVVPFVGFFALVYLLVVRGQDHDNAYGPARSSGLPSSATFPAV